MNKAIFLDRDGVINEDFGYVVTEANLQFIPGVLEFMKSAIDNDYLLVIVTNQSGIARGYFSEKQFNQFMTALINQTGFKHMKEIYYYYDATHPDINGYSFFRKPNPGMILQAARELEIDLQKSILIGDSLSDVEAGFKAGVAHLYLLGQIPSISNLSEEHFDFISTFKEVKLSGMNELEH